MSEQQSENWKTPLKEFQGSQRSQINKNCQQDSYLTIGPIHSISQSILGYSKINKIPRKPAFGSTASKQPIQFNGNKKSDIVAYSRINYSINQKYQDKYQEIKPRLTPFLSSTLRFQRQNTKNPGPGNYNFPQIFKNKKSLKQIKGAMHSPFKKWQNQNKIIKQFSQQKLKTLPIQQRDENDNVSNFEIQQRIKNKKQQVKQKLLKLRQFMKRQGKKDIKPILSSSSQINDKQNKSYLIESRQKFEGKQTTRKLNLKEITNNFLPKTQYNFQKEQFRTGSKVKNFKDAHNYHPIFMSKNQNLYQSYIQKHEGPGPGYYQKKSKKFHRRQSYTIKKFFS